MDDPLALLLQLPRGPARPCPYLPGRTTVNIAFLADALDPDLYHALMDRRFRRSGRLFYRPECPGCRECVPIRVPTASFEPTKSQRRSARRNPDLLVAAAPPRFTPEKQDLYVRYVRGQHGTDEDGDGLQDFLYDSPVDTLEFEYRTSDGRLVGVGICDVCGSSLSSVYFYFDPDEARRGLGTFSALFEIQWARERGIPYYYLGFYIRGCGRMNYKARFRPCELLDPATGRWRPYDPAADGPPDERGTGADGAP